jgi:hypothetical protein
MVTISNFSCQVLFVNVASLEATGISFEEWDKNDEQKEKVE